MQLPARDEPPTNMTTTSDSDFRLNRVRTIWEFVRGDLPSEQFEAFLYGDPDLEQLLGGELYLLAIGVDYRDRNAVHELRDEFRRWAREASPTSCKCIELRDLHVIDIGEEGCVFQSLREVVQRGDPYWWLSLHRCVECAQWWLIAQEERHNDIYCLRRLSDDVGKATLDEGRWPDDFDQFELLLEIGRDTGRSATFLDPLGSSLQWSVVDLARERPGISVARLASLLAIDVPTARVLAVDAIQHEHVEINLDGDD